MRPKAILFDVDGTLAETEEVHRAAFNATFAEAGLDWVWDEALYRDLLKVTGGKERMRHHADRTGTVLSDATIAATHAAKTRRYARLVRDGACALRPGVEAAIRGAHAQGIRLAIATTTSHPNVDALLAATLEREGKALFEVIAAGDDVPRKKPAPDVYLLALERLGLPAEDCIAVEDSANGVASARAAGIAVWVTPSLYTAHETFAGATKVLLDLSGFERLTEAAMPAAPLPLVGRG